MAESSAIVLPLVENFFSFPGARVNTVGQSRAADLSSWKYFIRQIQICEELTVSQTGYTNPQNCVTLYRKPDNNGFDYVLGSDYSYLASRARTDQVNFVDLMDPASRSGLNTSFYLQRAHAHSYNWGAISWYPVAKFNATVAINDVGGGTTTSYKTHDGSTSFVGGNYFQTASTATFTNGIAEEAVVVHTSDGSWFKFQSPLTILSSEIDRGTEYVLDLVLNTEGLVKGFASGTSTRSNVLKDASSNEMDIPLLDFSPVPHLASETVTREAYVFDSTTASPAAGDHFKIRLDLYYITSDATKTIYAVESKTLFRMVGTESSNYTVADVADFPKVAYVTENNDGTLNFKMYDQSSVIQNFTRQTATGSSATATIRCSTAGWTFNGCAAGDSVTMQYTLLSQGTL